MVRARAQLASFSGGSIILFETVMIGSLQFWFRYCAHLFNVYFSLVFPLLPIPRAFMLVVLVGCLKNKNNILNQVGKTATGTYFLFL